MDDRDVISNTELHPFSTGLGVDGLTHSFYGIGDVPDKMQIMSISFSA